MTLARFRSLHQVPDVWLERPLQRASSPEAVSVSARFYRWVEVAVFKWTVTEDGFFDHSIVSKIPYRIRNLKIFRIFGNFGCIYRIWRVR